MTTDNIPTTSTNELDHSLLAVLEGAYIDAAVFSLVPDYRALLIVVDGLETGPSDATSEQMLQRAEEFAHNTLAQQPVSEITHIAAWREAYRAFGAKPQRTRNSLEALTRRADKGLPRVNRLTDIYNAISVLHQVPVGGENIDAYVGAPQLIRASGTEPFDTADAGEAVVEFAEPGEVVWCDDSGVTCRRWNWRQARRTQLTDGTTRALFIFDALGAMTDAELHTAAEELLSLLRTFSPNLTAAQRLLRANDSA